MSVRRAVTLTRSQALALYLAALDGEEWVSDTARRLPFQRAMHALATTFGFQDHYPEEDGKKASK